MFFSTFFYLYWNKPPPLYDKLSLDANNIDIDIDLQGLEMEPLGGSPEPL